MIVRTWQHGRTRAGQAAVPGRRDDQRLYYQYSLSAKYIIRPATVKALGVSCHEWRRSINGHDAIAGVGEMHTRR